MPRTPHGSAPGTPGTPWRCWPSPPSSPRGGWAPPWGPPPSLGPTVTALIEDFTFRHALLLRLPVWGRAMPAAALVLVNALVFGLIHVNNVDGHWLLTLSYAGAGLVMNLVYLWTRNIWHVLLMHALNNFLLGGPLTVLLVKLLSDAVG
ncbi:CPBP family intramembrane glutamic endopeptidase [Kocuria rhizophila]|uniref:CPBP family intramembrane glutamic endopeptidase n=1 Tax=Kocuria rhizophila TaxID=72000 RepID=UPI001D7DF98C|nr:CPBP family intramembrane glutamic endopeptidase [Kocuria rhizophila]MCC5672528.1 CPBP family intramembrane metalloprotease [Kocuria rhizophila]